MANPLTALLANAFYQPIPSKQTVGAFDTATNPSAFTGLPPASKPPTWDRVNDPIVSDHAGYFTTPGFRNGVPPNGGVTRSGLVIDSNGAVVGYKNPLAGATKATGVNTGYSQAMALQRAQDQINAVNAAAGKPHKQTPGPAGTDTSTGGFPQQPDWSIPNAPQVQPITIANPNGNGGDILKSLNGIDLGLDSHLPAGLAFAQNADKYPIAALMNQNTQGANSISQFDLAAQQALAGLNKQVGGYYDNAIGLQGRISNAIGKSLQNQSPNAQQQQDLQNTGAPAGQAAQVANSNQVGYGLSGSVLSGIGNLDASGLAAQKANAQSYTAQIPALLALSGSQALSNLGSSTQSALAKILAGEAPLALKYATGEQSGNIHEATNLQNLYKTVTGNNTKIATANLTQAGENARADASNQLSGQRNKIAAFNAQVNAYRAKNPAVSAGVTNSSISDLQQWHDGVRSQTTTTSHSASGGDSNSQSNTKSAPPKSYAEAYHLAQVAHPGWTPDKVASFVNGAYDTYGDGGRPLDPPMIQALQQAGLPTSFAAGVATDSNGKQVKTWYLTNKQYLALVHAGYPPYASHSSLPNGDVHWNISQRS